MAKAWRNWLRAWEDFHVDGDEYRELDGERVFVLVRYGGRGNPSGLQVEPIDAACLFHLHDGKVVKLVLYWDRSQPTAGTAASALGHASPKDSPSARRWVRSRAAASNSRPR